jgi:hypothetical protein
MSLIFMEWKQDASTSKFGLRTLTRIVQVLVDPDSLFTRFG